MSTKKESTKKTLFDTLYEGAEDAIKAMRKPVAMRNIKRKIRSGYDDAQVKIDEANEAVQEEIKKVTKADMQVCLEHRATIRSCIEIQEDLAAIYEEYFSTKFDPNVD